MDATTKEPVKRRKASVNKERLTADGHKMPGPKPLEPKYRGKKGTERLKADIRAKGYDPDELLMFSYMADDVDKYVKEKYKKEKEEREAIKTEMVNGAQVVTEMSEEAMIQLIEESDPAQLESLRRSLLVQVARANDNAVGYTAFYELIFGQEPPEHAKRWIEAFYDAHANEEWVVLEAFRGSTKTTTLTIGFTAWRMGKEPDKSNLVIQAADDMAEKATKTIADIIENNSGWKEVFPGVVPDYKLGWSTAGYQIRVTDDVMPYEEWRKLCAKRNDPSLLGGGYESRVILGKHPTGVLVIDDMDNHENTTSVREKNSARIRLTGTIFPTIVASTWVMFVGTPWTMDDTLHYILGTGQARHLKTAAYYPDPEGKWIFDGKQVNLTWPKEYDVKRLTMHRRTEGAYQFARMYSLDLTTAANQIFKYVSFPNQFVNYNLPMVGGVDYAGLGDLEKLAEGKTDFFAMCYLAKLPEGGAVVIDGVLERCTQAQAERYVKQAQLVYPLWRTAVVESIGKGEEFIQVLRRNPGIKIMPMTPGRRNKNERLLNELQPWLESGILRISDAETPFLNELRTELDSFPFCTQDDTLDALYYAVKGMPDVFIVRDNTKGEDDEGYTREYNNSKYKRSRNPYSALFNRRRAV